MGLPPPWELLTALAVVAAGWDLLRGRIPETVTGTGLLLGVSLAATVGWSTLCSHAAAMLLTAFFLSLFYNLNCLSGDDVRLGAALAALGGFPFLIPFLLWTGLYTLLAYWIAARDGRGIRLLAGWLRQLFRRGSPQEERLPYGLLMGLATLTTFYLGLR